MRHLALVTLFVGSAFGQNGSHVFHLASAAQPGRLDEIAITLRTVAEIYQLSRDADQGTLTVNGSAPQLTMAEWLVPRLDAGRSPRGAEEFTGRPGSDDVLVVYSLSPTTTPMRLQEIVTTLRTVGELTRVFTISGSNLVALRGSGSQVSLAKFLLSQLDQEDADVRSAVVHEFPVNGDQDVAAVYPLLHAASPKAFQEIVTALRTVEGIPRIFLISVPPLLTFRGSASDVKASEWLIARLDRQTADEAGNESSVNGGPGDVTRVYYPKHIASTAVPRLLTEVRENAHISKAARVTVPPALVFRGTEDQVAAAIRILEKADQSSLQ